MQPGTNYTNNQFKPPWNSLGPLEGTTPSPSAPQGAFRLCAGTSAREECGVESEGKLPEGKERRVWVGGKGKFTGGEVLGGSKRAKGRTPRLTSCLTSKL